MCVGGWGVWGGVCRAPSAQVPRGSWGQQALQSTDPPWGYSVRFAEVEDDKEEEENPLLVPLEEKAVLQEEQASLWFSKVSRGWGPRHTRAGVPWEREVPDDSPIAGRLQRD